jgi:hypothetical protein
LKVLQNDTTILEILDDVIDMIVVQCQLTARQDLG